MRPDTETLKAFLAGDLDEAEMERIAALIDADPDLAAELDQLDPIRGALEETYQPVLDEAVPDHLSDAIRNRAESPAVAEPDETVLPFRRARSQGGQGAGFGGWPAYGAIAASLVLGVLIGSQVMQGGNEAFTFQGERLVASGALAEALDHQVSGRSDAGETSIQLSFASQSGGFCRTFRHRDTAGLACRDGGEDAAEWTIEMTLPADASADPAIRTAASALPTAILDAIDARAASESLDPDAEAAAIARDWQPAD